MINSFLLKYSSGTARISIICTVIFVMTGCLTCLFAVEAAPPGLLGNSLKKSAPAVNNALEGPSLAVERRAVIVQGDFSYENATLAEDVTWRGTVLVRGYLVIAPQATLRIEPGTVVRFMKSAILRQVPRLVIMGRLQCNGTEENPVLFAPNFAEAARGDWGGVLLLSSEKRNQCDNSLFEGAETAIEAHFSTITAKGVTVRRAGTGLLLRDSVVALTTSVINDCETGLEVHDSELDLREVALSSNRRGIAAYRSSLALTMVNVSGSKQQGVMANECRVKFNACDLALNAVGALLKGGEGQVLMSRFEKNSDVGLHLSGARIKVQRCLFADNLGDGLRMDDGRGIVWASAFSGNGGYNLANNGQEDVSAVLNWWGSNDEATITAKLPVSSKDTRFGAIAYSPWLAEKPTALPKEL